ncbi:MAG: phosphoenolpyruvate synthase [Anaerolineae bacterium]|nr:phosphoenolpyruvate synthase [Anaerolineae bacterium]
MGSYVLALDAAEATLEQAGGKGASLAQLVAAGLPVPDGFHLTTAAYRRFVAENNLETRIAAALEPVLEAHSSGGNLDPAMLERASDAIRAMFVDAPIPPEIAGAVARAYAELHGQRPAVAVRSSATAEDLPGLSFAGQQETYLNVQGVDEVLDAVRRCWASLWTARAIGYRTRNGIDHGAVSLAVVVQELVPAEAAGVLFTANPLTGARGEALISAAWGLGESVVSGAVTPDMLRVDKARSAVVGREIAVKEVMTVRVNGGTQEQPVPEELRRAPVLDDEAAQELVQLGVRIETLYGQPMDIEWATVDGAFHIVQARPITALPEPEAPPPTEWPLPDPKGQYMRASIVDLMPDPLTPLYGTLGLSRYGAGINRLVEHVGRSETDDFAGILTTINDYAYMVVSYPARAWRYLIFRFVPRFGSMLRNGIARWRDEVHPAYAEAARRWGAAAETLDAAEIWRGVHEILDIAADHLGALMVGTMGISAGTEMLFTRVYEGLVRREGDPEVSAFLMGYDSIPIQSEKSLYDLAAWCAQDDALRAHMLSAPPSQLVDALREGRRPAAVAADVWQELGRRLDAHLRRFGHIVYDMDFGKPLPLDDPAPMLQTVQMYMRGEGGDPYERQRAFVERRERETEAALSRLKGVRRWLFRVTLRWAQRQAAVREDGLAEIGLGYPQLRRLLRELGQRMVAAGSIEAPDDVFWVVEDELESAVQALADDEPLPALAERVRTRKAQWRAAQRVTPPPQIPTKERYMGMKVESFLAVEAGDQTGDTITGAATSPGKVTAPACVLEGPQDFCNMRQGYVLVARATTPAWTPLFAMAAGLVTDVGGPLSHGSIVAREYGIPAVLGTGVATRRIRDGQTITVDGSAGTVTLSEVEA